MDGGSIAGTMFIVFLILKLTHTITWSWWWVVSPVLIDTAVTILVIMIAMLFGFSIFKFYKKFIDF